MSSTRVNPSDEQWKAARLLVAAFNDTDCRCDGIVLTEGAKENLKIKVAYALQHREQEVRAAERERAARLICGLCCRPSDYRTVELDPDGLYYHKRIGHEGSWKEYCEASYVRRDDTPQEGEQSK